MSAHFILRYGGRAVELRGSDYRLGDDAQATHFINAAAAWYAAFKNQLAPHRCDVVCLAEKAETLKAENLKEETKGAQP